jgi:hypothetical protein
VDLDGGAMLLPGDVGCAEGKDLEEWGLEFGSTLYK